MKKSITLFAYAALLCTAFFLPPFGGIRGGLAQVNRTNTKKSIPYKANYQRMAADANANHTLEIRDGTLWAWDRFHAPEIISRKGAESAMEKIII